MLNPNPTNRNQPIEKNEKYNEVDLTDPRQKYKNCN